MRRFAQVSAGVVALKPAPAKAGGKRLPRSFDRAAGKSPLYLVSAWAVDQLRAKTASPALVLGQRAVDGKSNEITAIPKQPCPAAPARAQPRQTRTRERLHERQDQARRLGQ